MAFGVFHGHLRPSEAIQEYHVDVEVAFHRTRHGPWNRMGSGQESHLAVELDNGRSTDRKG